jgi:hypothetical protein
MAHDVFISYSTKDKPTADAVCAKLEANGVRCWIAPRDILPGEEWGSAIIDGLDNARLMIVVFSSHANESQQIRREVERAVNKGRSIITFRIENVVPEKSLEYFLSTPHWLDALTPPLEAHLDYLAETVKLLLDRQQGSKVPPRRHPPPALQTPFFTRRNLLVAGAIVTGGILAIIKLYPAPKSTLPDLHPAVNIAPAVSIAGNWLTTDGGPVVLTQIGTRVAGAYRGTYPHVGLTGSINGDFDGSNFVGTFENREGSVTGHGKLTLALKDKTLEGVWISDTAPGQSGPWVMRRKPQGCFEAAGYTTRSHDRQAYLEWARQHPNDIISNLDREVDVVSGCMSDNLEQWATLFGKVSAIVANAATDPQCFGGDAGVVVRDEGSHRAFALSRSHDFILDNLKWKTAAAIRCVSPDRQRALFADISAALSAPTPSG